MLAEIFWNLNRQVAREKRPIFIFQNGWVTQGNEINFRKA
jgi:hypothetical protein